MSLAHVSRMAAAAAASASSAAAAGSSTAAAAAAASSGLPLATQENRWLVATFSLQGRSPASLDDEEFAAVGRAQYAAGRFHLAIRCLEIFVARRAAKAALGAGTPSGQGGATGGGAVTAAPMPHGSSLAGGGGQIVGAPPPSQISSARSGPGGSGGGSSSSLPLGALHLLGNAHLRNGDLRRARECFLACVRLGYDADWQMLVQIELDASAAAREATHRQARQGQEAVATLNKHLAQHAQAEVQAQAQGLGIGLGGPPAPQRQQRQQQQQSQSKQCGRDAASADTATAASFALDRAEAEAAIAAGATATQSQSGPALAENDVAASELSDDEDEGGVDDHDAAALDSSFAAQVRVAGISAPLFEPVRPVSPGAGGGACFRSDSASAPGRAAAAFDTAPIVSAATGGVSQR